MGGWIKGERDRDRDRQGGMKGEEKRKLVIDFASCQNLLFELLLGIL